jgi:uncharacterized protein (DUF885 family)
MEAFAQEYPRLEIPNFGFDYRENFKQIPSLDKLRQQRAFFDKYQKKLIRINPSTLSKLKQGYYHQLRYEAAFNLQRIALEEKFRQNPPDSIPENGLSTMPQAREWYAYYAQRYTSLVLTAEELYAFGMQEIKRCQAEIRQIQKELGYEKDSAGFYQQLNQAEMYLTDKAQVLAEYARIDRTVRKHLHTLFRDTVVALVKIDTWQNAGPHTPPGYYQPADRLNTQATFYFNFHNQRHNQRVLDWIYIHEALPGHHYQFSLRQKAKEEPTFRRFFMYAGNFEGWGAYAEYLGEQIGLYQNPYTRLGKWEWDLVRSLRVVLDVGIHAKGWTTIQALAFWKQNIANQDDIAEREVRRCTQWNGQVLSYKIGAWKIQQILEKRKRKEGKDFDIRRFHADYLAFGQMPLTVIERMME